MIRQSGVKPAAVGGIAAGIAGGFLLLGALGFILLRRKRNQDENYYVREAQAEYPYETGRSINSPMGTYNNA